jgi:hypothetical protein
MLTLQISTKIGVVFAMAKSTWFRVILGFLVAPISPGLLTVILASLFRAGTTGFDTPKWSEAAFIIWLSGVLGYPVAIFFGIPLHLLFRRRSWNGLLVYIGAGALLGFVVYLVYVILVEYAANGLFGNRLRSCGCSSILADRSARSHQPRERMMRFRRKPGLDLDRPTNCTRALGHRN